MIPRLLAVLGLLSAAFAGAKLVDAGSAAHWPPSARIALGVAVFFATVGAMVVLHSLLSPDHSGLGPALESDRRGPALSKGILSAAAVLLTYFALSKALEFFVGVPVERTLLAGFALALTWATARKPWWFWDHWKAHLVRRVIGDTATTLVYLTIAALALYLAILGHPERVLD